MEIAQEKPYALYRIEVFIFFLQKLEILFRIRVVDGSSGKGYLPHDVEMPLLTDLVDR
jgi:hypothetical protein